MSLPWATREVKPVDRYTNESSLKTNMSLIKSDGMKQESFLKLNRKVHEIYILVCFM